MTEFALVIGNKNYSSWSLRAWLALKHSGVPFEEIVIPLRQAETREHILSVSPSGKVPVLRHGEASIWESLAICEYLAELFPDAGLWPEDRAARASARAISAEMHAGFAALRRNMPMNMRVEHPGAEVAEDVRQDINRIEAIWRDCRRRFGAGGDMLFGSFTIADAMFAPVASRLRTYAVKLDDTGEAYVEAVMGLTIMQEWMTAARNEPWIIPDLEPGIETA